MGWNLTYVQECPTLWRLYEYLADEEQEHTLRTREDRRNRSLGEGGEGYIATDEWCYNCGCCGHWGDVSPPFPPVASSESPSRIARIYRTEGIFLRNRPLSAHTTPSQVPSLTPSFHVLLHIAASLASGNTMTSLVRVMTYHKMLANRVGGRTLKGWRKE